MSDVTPEELIPLISERMAMSGGGLLQITFEIPSTELPEEVDEDWARWIINYLHLLRSGRN